jgi:hypothetical protein
MRFSQPYNSKEYNIEKTADYDDIETVKPWQRWMISLQPIIGIMSLGTYAIYFTYRFLDNYPFRKGFDIGNGPTINLLAELVCLGFNS